MGVLQFLLALRYGLIVDLLIFPIFLKNYMRFSLGYSSAALGL
jgi:hypothetical protein